VKHQYFYLVLNLDEYKYYYHFKKILLTIFFRFILEDFFNLRKLKENPVIFAQFNIEDISNFLFPIITLLFDFFFFNENEG
jgi:hypothetical protein